MNNGLNILKILIIGSIGILTSCAPLRPIAPEQEKRRVETNQNRDLKKVTGIDAWDRVLYPWIGTPYLLGGTSKNGTDCSGFTSGVYREKEGIYLPRTSGDQSKTGKSVSQRNLKVGDLIYFGEKSKVNHVGIYVGNGDFIHASTSKGVTVTPLSDSYWKPRYMGARRIL